MKYLRYLKESKNIPDELIDNFQEIEDITDFNLVWIRVVLEGSYIYKLTIDNIDLETFEKVLRLEKRLESFKIFMINSIEQKSYYTWDGGESKFIKSGSQQYGSANADVRESVRQIRKIFTSSPPSKLSKLFKKDYSITKIKSLEFIIKSIQHPHLSRVY